MRYAVVIEKAGNNYSALFPISWGVSLPDLLWTEQLIREAIELHLAGLREDGSPIPQPSSQVEYIEVAA